MSNTTADEIAEQASLYQEFLAERDEVLKHKWIRSEEAGLDVGLETALVDWAIHCRESWKKEFKANQKS